MADDGNGPGFDLRAIIANSLLEWEEHVAAVAVAGGCNWRCPFCHSWRFVTGLADLEPVPLDDWYALLARQEGWIDGAVFSGGEPTLQPGLEEVIRKTREYGVKIKLHTNGSRPEVIERLLGERLIDCLALDFKSPLDGRLAGTAGLTPDGAEAARERVMRSFALARKSGIEREYHTTLCPAFIDRETFGAMSDWLEAGGVWFLQRFEPDDCLDGRAAGRASYSREELDRFAAVAAGRGRKVVVKPGKAGG